MTFFSGGDNNDNNKNNPCLTIQAEETKRSFTDVHTQICLHDISIPEGWKVKEEESHSEECSISIDEQV